jgi:hypothetical protein
MTRCRSQQEVLQDGKGKEDIKPRAQAGPGAGRRRAGLRGALRSEEDQEIGAVKKAVKKVGTSRKRVERRLGR